MPLATTVNLLSEFPACVATDLDYPHLQTRWGSSLLQFVASAVARKRRSVSRDGRCKKKLPTGLNRQQKNGTSLSSLPFRAKTAWKP